jgi:copper(I)-binding protein
MKTVILAGLFLGLAAPLAAHEYKVGALVIDHPVLRVSSPVARTGAGFLTIRNTGNQADRLLSISTDASNRADMHGTIRDGNVMRMRAQADGVPVPAGGKTAFAPGGLHVMFIGLKAPVPEGRLIKARLTFEKAGTVDVAFKAESAANATNHQH